MQVGEIQIGSDVPSMLKSDLELEYRVQEHLKRVSHCVRQSEIM